MEGDQDGQRYVDADHADFDGVGQFASLGQITEEHYDYIFDINVKGTLFTVQKALPLMKNGGSIILTGSTVGSMVPPR
ncbi:SDR family oxidoreductase [Chromohalobacter sp.]|uniref:SDR family oxidoreductase n=1 Tax=Chromohalobacter sp. TaxID=50740 RepID=UPI00257B5E27|nr:SDR family oxidoreductase [Chromohalobacter sp.]